MFPYYLSIGMTEEQYWDRDCTLVKAYRDADKLRLERQNTMLWLQGQYIYEALCDVSPVFHAFAKKGTKPAPYRDAPYPLSKSEVEDHEEEKAKKIYNKGMARMLAFMEKSKKKEEVTESGN